MPSNGPSEGFHNQLIAGIHLLEAQRAEEAIRLLERAHSLQPGNLDAILNLSAAYILTEKWRLAVASIKRVIEHAPDNLQLWVNLGAVYLGNPVLENSEQQLKAISAFEAALEIDPGL